MSQFHLVAEGFRLRQAFGAVSEQLLAEKSRWILWSPVALGLGIASYFLAPNEPSAWHSGIFILAIMPLLWFFRGTTWIWLLTTIAFLMCLGFFAATIRSNQVATPFIAKKLGGALQGRVCRIENRRDRQRLVLDQLSISRLAPDVTPKRLRVSLRGKTRMPEIRPGQLVRLRAVLLPPPDPIVPGGFDFARHLYYQSIGAVGFAYRRPEVIGQQALGLFDGCGGWFATVRTQVIAAIKRADLGPAEAMAIALMAGERGELPERTLADLRAAGLAHLLAISGLHVGLIATSIFFLLRFLLAACEPLALRYPIKKWAALAAIAGAGCYMLLTGATIPTQRAFMMLAVFLGAILLDRAAISMRAVMLAALLILLLAPESLLSASFQLSFAAVVALVAFYEAARELLSRLRSRAGWSQRMLLYITGVGLTTVVAGGATSLFAIQHFNQVAVYSLLGNLVAVPLMAVLVMPAAVVAYCLMPVGLEAPVLVAMSWGIEGILWIAREVAQLPGAVIGVATPNSYFIPLVALGGLWLCLWQRPWRFCALPVIGFAVFSLGWLQPAKPLAVVNESGKTFAVWQQDRQIHLRGTRSGSMTDQRWRRTWDGDIRAHIKKSTSSAFTCDRLACVFKRPDLTLSYIRDARALAEDCDRADIVIATIPAGRNCRPRLGLIDRFDLWRHGSHALYLDNGTLRIETVREKQSRRPWVKYRRKKKPRRK